MLFDPSQAPFAKPEPGYGKALKMNRMKLQIEKPTWWKLINGTFPPQFSVDSLAKWFEENVEPINKMLAEGVEVFSKYDKTYLGYMWSTADNHHQNHKALLINIQPIEKETAEDVLRDFIEVHKAFNLSGPTRTKTQIDMTIENASAIYERAKAVLGDV